MVLTVLGASACFNESETVGDTASTVATTSTAGTGDSSTGPATTSGVGDSTGDTATTESGGEPLPGCDAYCSACFDSAAYDGCYDQCAATHEMMITQSGVPCGDDWLSRRACIATDPACDLSPMTTGPCRAYWEEELAICSGTISGNCGRHPDQGAGPFDYCDGEPSTAGSCPPDVLLDNVGEGSDACGSLPLFEGCCSAAGNYFYCQPHDDIGLTYEECAPP